MNDAYDTWRCAALSGTYTPIDEQRIREMFLATTQNGPPNCWTGTTGTLSTMIRELLREREHMICALWTNEEVEA